jgi:hypothetical protein
MKRLLALSGILFCTLLAGAWTPSAAPAQALTAGTPTLTPTVCPPGGNYVIIPTTGTLEPGTTDVGNHCDACLTFLTLPFPVRFYFWTFNTMHVDSNGELQFQSANPTLDNACLPVMPLNAAIMPHWDDLRTDAQSGCAGYPGGLCGIFTSVTGSAPGRVFNIEWRAVYAGSGLPINFEVRLYEAVGINGFDVVFGTVGESGSSATVGVQNEGGANTQYSCNAAVLSPNLMLVFRQPPCSPPTTTPTPGTPTATATLGLPTETATLTATVLPTGTPTATAPPPTASATPTPAPPQPRIYLPVLLHNA